MRMLSKLITIKSTAYFEKKKVDIFNEFLFKFNHYFRFLELKA